jgi:hypothetical protein
VQGGEEGAHPEGDGPGEHNEGSDRVRSDVRVAALEQRDDHEDYKSVHVGCVELERDIGGADVVARGHDTNHYQCHPHGIEVDEGSACPELLLLLTANSLPLVPQLLLLADHQQIKEAEDDVAGVAEEVVPHPDVSKRAILQAEEVVVAVVHVLVQPEGEGVTLDPALCFITGWEKMGIMVWNCMGYLANTVSTNLLFDIRSLLLLKAMAY